jgi:hypothetical protein
VLDSFVMRSLLFDLSEFGVPLDEEAVNAPLRYVARKRKVEETFWYDQSPEEWEFVFSGEPRQVRMSFFSMISNSPLSQAEKNRILSEWENEDVIIRGTKVVCSGFTLDLLHLPCPILPRKKPRVVRPKSIKLRVSCDDVDMVCEQTVMATPVRDVELCTDMASTCEIGDRLSLLENEPIRGEALTIKVIHSTEKSPEVVFNTLSPGVETVAVLTGQAQDAVNDTRLWGDLQGVDVQFLRRERDGGYQAVWIVDPQVERLKCRNNNYVLIVANGSHEVDWSRLLVNVTPWFPSLSPVPRDACTKQCDPVNLECIVQDVKLPEFAWVRRYLEESGRADCLARIVKVAPYCNFRHCKGQSKTPTKMFFSIFDTQKYRCVTCPFGFCRSTKQEGEQRMALVSSPELVYLRSPSFLEYMKGRVIMSRDESTVPWSTWLRNISRRALVMWAQTLIEDSDRLKPFSEHVFLSRTKLASLAKMALCCTTLFVRSIVPGYWHLFHGVKTEERIDVWDFRAKDWFAVLPYVALTRAIMQPIEVRVTGDPQGFLTQLYMNGLKVFSIRREAVDGFETSYYVIERGSWCTQLEVIPYKACTYDSLPVCEGEMFELVHTGERVGECGPKDHGLGGFNPYGNAQTSRLWAERESLYGDDESVAREAEAIFNGWGQDRWSQTISDRTLVTLHRAYKRYLRSRGPHEEAIRCFCDFFDDAIPDDPVPERSMKRKSGIQ